MVVFLFFLTLWIASVAAFAGSTTEKKPWDGLRFLQQSYKFVNLPFVTGSARTQQVSPGDELWRFGPSSLQQRNNNVFSMAPLDDVVMGGASASSFDQSTGSWCGTVTDANNGGFVGIRSTPGFTWNAKRCRGLEWELNLDGRTARRVKFVLRDSTDFNGITWTTIANVKPGRNKVKIDFGRQVAARFAKVIADETFRKENVVGVQVTYSKFEFDGKLNPTFVPGDLSLRLLSLRAY